MRWPAAARCAIWLPACKRPLRKERPRAVCSSPKVTISCRFCNKGGCLLPFLLFALALDPCGISGTVVDSLTGKGLAKVEISLEPVETGASHIATAQSDAEGHF